MNGRMSMQNRMSLPDRFGATGLVGDLQLAFTSATSSTSSSYPAQVEGTAGLTVELFNGASSLGNMTESSPGVYELGDTLAALSTTYTAKVNGVEYATRTVAFTDGFTWQAEYRFDSGSGQTLVDYSGNGYDGTLGGTGSSESTDPTWASEYLAFDTNDYISIPQAALTNAKTILFCSRVPNAGANGIVLAGATTGTLVILFGNEAGNRSIGTGAVNVAYRSRSVALASLVAGQDRIVAAVRRASPNTDKLFVSGAEVSYVSQAAGAADPTGTAPFIGRDGGAGFFNGGRMYYLKISATELTNQQIADATAYLKAHAKTNKPTLYASLP